MGAPLTEVERNRIGKLFDALKKKYSNAECNWQWNRSITIEKFIASSCEFQVNLGKRPRVVYFTLYARTPDGGNVHDRQKVMEWVNAFRNRYKNISVPGVEEVVGGDTKKQNKEKVVYKFMTDIDWQVQTSDVWTEKIISMYTKIREGVIPQL